MSELMVPERSVPIMMYTSDIDLLDQLVSQANQQGLNDSLIQAGRTYQDKEARKRLIQARKEVLHQVLTAAPAQIKTEAGENIQQMSDAELLQAYEKYPVNSGIIAEIVQRWLRVKKQAQLPLAAGDDIYYADAENGFVEHGTVFVASYKDGRLDSFSVDFDDGDFNEFVGEALGRSFFKDKDDAAECVRKGEND